MEKMDKHLVLFSKLIDAVFLFLKYNLIKGTIEER
jgi:hypothetical protein